jgi:hypothetical protein
MYAIFATTKKSSQLDGDVRKVSKEIKTTLVRRSTLPKDVGGVGCSPDGGAFYNGNKLSIAFEAKHQGRSGNAIERAWKNAYLVLEKHKAKRYVIFMTGEGVLKGNSLATNAQELERAYKGRLKCYLKQDGFTTAQLKRIMTKEINETL